MGAAHPVVEPGVGLLGKSLPDRAILCRGSGDLQDMPAAAPGCGALFGQGFRRGLVFGILVLVQLVKNECADRLVAQPADRARPAKVNRHVGQVDAQGRDIIAIAGHVVGKAGA